MAITHVAIETSLPGGFELPTSGLPAEHANHVPWQLEEYDIVDLLY